MRELLIQLVHLFFPCLLNRELIKTKEFLIIISRILNESRVNELEHHYSRNEVEFSQSYALNENLQSALFTYF